VKLISDLHTAWNGLSERERQGLGLAGWVSLASQAAELRRSAAAAAAQGEAGRPKPAVVDDGSRALVVQALGNRARLELQGTAVWVTVDGVDGEQLRQGLKTLPVRWGAHPAQADLSATPDGLRGRIRLQWTAP